MSGMARATALRALVPRCLPEELVRGGGLLQALHHQLGPARRHFSTDGPGSEVARQEEEAGEDNVYTGPFGTAVGKVKKLSLFSAACALAAGPIIFGLDAQSTFTAKASIAGTLATFGVFTTGLLQWFTSPYVQQLVYDPKTETVEATTLNLFAQPRTTRFHLAEVQPAESVHPLSSFKVHNKLFYLDADHFSNKELLLKLAPVQAAAHAVAEADEQRERKGQKQEGGAA